MLSIGKLVPGRADYYLGTVANGVEDYYTGAGEAPGEWLGRSAERLGLAGEVEPEALHRVLDHEHPDTGERLTRGHSVPKVIGFDTTFCAPKSVSLLYGLGDPETANEVRNAHDAAVTRAVAVYQEIAHGRRGAGGTTTVAGDGFVAAAFRHRTSRAQDPHLHTHVVVANLVYAETDERWSALDGRPLYQWCRTVGHLYDAQLRHELTTRLGVAWGPVRHGLADIAGVPAAVIKAFSTRRTEIEADLATRGLTSAKAAQASVYRTRAAKPTGVTTELIDEWRAQAAGLGFDAAALAATLARSPAMDVPPAGSFEADRLYAHLASPQGLTAHRSTFGRREVIEAICDALPAGGSIDDILELTDAFLRSPQAVGLGVADDTALHRRAGALIPAGREEPRYSTPDMIAVEQHLLAGAARRRQEHAGVARSERLEAALAARPTITAEQAAMVTRVCGSGAGVELVVGLAGSGKTFALAAAHEAWTASGFSVHGLCLAAKAARRLDEGSTIPATTIDAFLRRLDRAQLEATDVLVVDEAAMVGTRKLARLLTYAEAAGAKVVLIGDPFQLPEIEAGGAFAGLARRLGATELTENRRQAQPWERAALGELRHGDPDTAVDAFVGHGRVHLAETIDELRDQLVAAWWEARERGERVLMCAPTRRECEELNDLARVRLAAHGRLYGDGQRIGDRHFFVGDQILAGRNDRTLGVLNGDELTITHLDPERRQLTAVGESGARVLPFAYAEAWVTPAHAVTIHKAQGATVDRTFVLADDTIARPHLYTALSRGKHANDLYVTVSDWRDEIRHAFEAETDPLDGLRHAAHRDVYQELAVDAADDHLVPSEALRAERDHLRSIFGHGPRDRSQDLREVTDRIVRVRAQRDNAQRRHDEARSDLDTLGPVGKRVHRKRRVDLEQVRDRATDHIVLADAKIRELSAQATEIAADLRAYRRWADRLEPQLARLRELDRTLAARVLDHRTLSPPARSVDFDPGLGL